MGARQNGGGRVDRRQRAGTWRASVCVCAKQLILSHHQAQSLDCEASEPAHVRQTCERRASKKVIDPDRYLGPLTVLSAQNFTPEMIFPLKDAQREGGGRASNRLVPGLPRWLWRT